MSTLVAKVSQIESCGSLHLVKFESHSQTLTMMSLDLHKSIKIGTRVKLAVKPSHIAISKKTSTDVSYSNQLPTIIKAIENGQLLSSIKLDFFGTTLESISTAESSKSMDLKVGESIVALINASELSISEVLDA